MSIQAIITLVALAAGVGYVVGWAVGDARGRAEQWVADYFDGVAKDKARRDERGRWKRRATLLRGKEAT
jgi:hypothetical protein